jgi:hypothetical protein
MHLVMAAAAAAARGRKQRSRTSLRETPPNRLTFGSFSTVFFKLNFGFNQKSDVEGFKFSVKYGILW